MELTLAEFRLLSFERKCDILIGGGYLMKRKLGFSPYEVLLYHVNCFFVEVHVNTKSQAVMTITAFDRADILIPYLDQISIRDLFEN